MADRWDRGGAFMLLNYNTMVVLVGVVLLGITCGVIGTFAVLRRRALMGDALAHASLPGLCIAYLLFERRDLSLLLTGALLSALLGVFVMTLLRRYTRVKEDAALGIVLSVFFGAGVVLSRVVQNRSSSGSKAGLDSFLLGKTAGMIAEDVLFMGIVSGGAILLIALLFKEFKAVTFDADFARAQGWPTVLIDALLLSLVALTVMIGLPAVGVVLVAALLIIPASAARFWTDRLEGMLLLSAAIGGSVGAIGALLSARFSGLPTGPMIVLTGALVLGISVTLAPRRGLVARLWADVVFQRRLHERLLLAEIHEMVEEQGAGVPRSAIIHRAAEASAFQRLSRQGLIASSGDLISLTDAGQRRGSELVRGAKLWEIFLQTRPEQAGALADLSEETVVGVLPSDMVAELEKQLKAKSSHVDGER